MPQIDPNTETAVANEALSSIKLTGILSLDADDSEKAKALRKFFASTRDALQRIYPWNFNEEYLALPANATAPLIRYRNRFPFLNDPYILRIRSVPHTHRRHWKVQGRSVLANCDAPLKVVASVRVTDVGRWDALFRTAFVAALAYAVAPELSKDDDTIARAKTAASDALARAFPVDASEGTADEFEEQDVILARY